VFLLICSPNVKAGIAKKLILLLEPVINFKLVSSKVPDAAVEDSQPGSKYDAELRRDPVK
jgi:hypothetical protein